MEEWLETVKKLDRWGVDVMMDGTFNHCAPDAIMGEGAKLIGLGKFADQKISEVRPQWFSKKGSPGQPASNSQEISNAPDRFDFPPWTDVIDFHYGSYKELVKERPDRHPVTGLKPPGKSNFSYMKGYDEFEGHTTYTRELWEYMSNYPRYWIIATGHPEGTPATKSHLGIDGLRCDFAQGMPSQFWEYCINKTRQLKWDFIFMAESLDGIWRTSDGRPVGVGYRSARHFDVMNENIVFYWRDQFFGYPLFPQVAGGGRHSTWQTREAYASRDEDMDGAVLLNNLVNHDEIYPHNDPMAIAYAYAQMAALPGAPMIFYGQEDGGQNSLDHYAFTQEKFGTIDPHSNFSLYENSMGKFIPNFKRYNDMRKIRLGGNSDKKREIRNFYSMVNNARMSSKALKSGNFVFLKKWGSSHDVVNHIFGVLRSDAPYEEGAEIIIALVNNDYIGNPEARGYLSLNLGRRGGKHYAGIDPQKTYNLFNLLSSPPNKPYWAQPKTGAEILSNPLEVGFPVDGEHAAYLHLKEVEAGGGATKQEPTDRSGRAEPPTEI
jgi:glycosidase